jgi:intracellular multiplication protein IcmT
MDLHWRNTQKPARFFMLDARASAATFLYLVHAKVWTFVVAVITMLLFWFLERHGLTFQASLRAFRVWFIGPKRPALRHGSHRHWIDYNE